MVRLIITNSLKEEINKVFKKKSVKIFEILYSLKNNPKKGKVVGKVAEIVIKELKFEVYRFYFITDGFKIKFLKEEEISDLLIKFVRMSKKDNQKKVIEEIKEILRKFNYKEF